MSWGGDSVILVEFKIFLSFQKRAKLSVGKGTWKSRGEMKSTKAVSHLVTVVAKKPYDSLQVNRVIVADFCRAKLIWPDDVDFACICHPLWQKFRFHPIWLLMTTTLLACIRSFKAENPLIWKHKGILRWQRVYLTFQEGLILLTSLFLKSD